MVLLHLSLNKKDIYLFNLESEKVLFLKIQLMFFFFKYKTIFMEIYSMIKKSF